MSHGVKILLPSAYAVAIVALIVLVPLSEYQYVAFDDLGMVIS